MDPQRSRRFRRLLNAHQGDANAHVLSDELRAAALRVVDLIQGLFRCRRVLRRIRLERHQLGRIDIALGIYDGHQHEVVIERFIDRGIAHLQAALGAVGGHDGHAGRRPIAIRQQRPRLIAGQIGTAVEKMDQTPLA